MTTPFGVVILRLPKSLPADLFGRKDFQKKTIRVFFWLHKCVGMQRLTGCIPALQRVKKTFFDTLKMTTPFGVVIFCGLTG
jgi:hypothetical protein